MLVTLANFFINKRHGFFCQNAGDFFVKFFNGQQAFAGFVAFKSFLQILQKQKQIALILPDLGNVELG
jgi:hypothetical protein